MRKIRMVLLIIGCLFTLVAGSGCGVNQADSAISRTAGGSGGIMRYPLLDDPASLDPATFEEELAINVGKEIFDGLVDIDFKSKSVVPAHAKEWEIKDNKVFTFYLRENTLFHNGKEVTSEDFKYSFERLLDPGTAATAGWILEGVKGAGDKLAGKSREVEGIKVIDKYTLEITLSAPSASFLSWLANPGAAVVDRNVIEEFGMGVRQTGAKPETVVGSGPFRLAEWVPKNHIKLTRNEDYYGTKARLSEVDFRIIPDETTAINEFRAGNLDFIENIPHGLGKVIDDEFPGQVTRNTVWDIEFYGFNLEKEPFKDNVKVRQALNFAIDREGIINAVLEGNSVPAKGVIPPGMAEYDPGTKGYNYDPQKALLLLMEAGYPRGEGLPELEIFYNIRESKQKVAEAVQAQLRSLGIKVSIKGLPLTVYKSEVGTGKFGIFRLGWTPDSLDAGSILYPLFSSEPQNFFRYKNPEVDRLLREAQSKVDQEERVKLYRAVEALIVEDAPAIWLYHSTNLNLLGKNVRGLELNPMKMIPLDRVWLEE